MARTLSPRCGLGRRSRGRTVAGVCVFVCALLACGAVAAQDAAEPGALESAYLLRLINEARTAPAAMLERAGIDLATARAALGPDAALLDTGLPPLALDERLTAAAQAHLEDMVTRLYYSSFTPEGLGPWDRVAAIGYDPVAVQEALGLLSIVTFVDWPEAVWIVFRQWLLEDLSAGPEARRIFSPWAVHAGVAFQPVRLELGGQTVNAYVAECDVARPKTLSSMIVGSVRAPGALGPFVDPRLAPSGSFIVWCYAAYGGLWWESLTDPLGGYQCPATPDRGPMVVEVRQPDTGDLLTWQITAAGESHTWLDIFLP